MKDKLITLFFLCAAGWFLGLLADGAKAQNHSEMGQAYGSKAWIRKSQLNYCMRLADDIDRQHCVERIK